MEDHNKIKDKQIVEIVRTKDKELYLEIASRYQEKVLRLKLKINNSNILHESEKYLKQCQSAGDWIRGYF